MPKVGIMPATAYHRVIATIRDYPRMSKELTAIKMETIGAAAYDGMPKGDSVDSRVERQAIAIADMEQTVRAIDSCAEQIPADMRDGILNHIWYRQPFPRNRYAQLVPSLSTWKREKQLFVVRVAHALRIYNK